MKKMLLAILSGLILVTAPFWGALAYGKIENRVMCWKVSNYVLENKGSIAVTEDHQSFVYKTTGMISAGVEYGFYYDSEDQFEMKDEPHRNGHRAYMREIETLCKDGWLVFSYDHTGCMASGGTDIHGFAQSLCDLDDCIKAIKADPNLGNRTVSVIGHSWGGFSTMNIGALHPDITHIIGMSGFVSVERIIQQTFSGIMKFYVKAIVDSELRASPRYGRFNALESLQKTQAKILLIYSDDDKTVHKSAHYDPLYEKLSGRENVEFLLLTGGKNHNPTYTGDAVKLKDAFFAEFQQAVKDKKLQTPEEQSEFMRRYDWYALTVQDMEVWNRIFDHLRK